MVDPPVGKYSTGNGKLVTHVLHYVSATCLLTAGRLLISYIVSDSGAIKKIKFVQNSNEMQLNGSIANISAE